MPSTSARFIAVTGALAAVLFHVESTHAQGTNATCLPQYSWMTNSRGQNPCLMAAYLNSACLADPTDAYVYSLPENFHYRPPSVQIATPCQCSTVFYSMIAACATCQDRTNLPWSGWQTNCSTDYRSVFPATIPAGTAIPAWAYLDVVNADAFNVTAAQADAAQDPPESTAPAAPTSTSSTSIGFSSGTAPPAHTESGAPVSGSSSKKSNVGPIVGGVVGGVGGAALLAGVIAFFVIRSRRNKVAPSAAYTSAPVHSPTNGAFSHDGGMGAQYAEKPAYDPGYAPSTVPSSALPIYDPNDPSTFPQPAPTPSIGGATMYNSSVNAGYGSQQGGYASTAVHSQQPYSHQPGGYSGVAEV